MNACINGHNKVVKVAFDHQDRNPLDMNGKDSHGRIPLFKTSLFWVHFQTLWSTKKLTISATPERQNNNDDRTKEMERNKKRGAKSFDVPSHYKSLQWLLRRKQDHCSIYVCSSSSIISPVKWSNHLRKVAAVDLYHTSPQRQRPFTILFPYLVFAVTATLNDKVKPFLPFRFSDIVKAVEM